MTKQELDIDINILPKVAKDIWWIQDLKPGILDPEDLVLSFFFIP